jgi:hypothetical protein
MAFELFAGGRIRVIFLPCITVGIILNRLSVFVERYGNTEFTGTLFGVIVVLVAFQVWCGFEEGLPGIEFQIRIGKLCHW